MRHSHAVSTIALALITTAASGQDAYRCTLEGGRVQYQEHPCQNGKQAVLKALPQPLARTEVKPPPPSWPGSAAASAPRGKWAAGDSFPLTLKGRSQPVDTMLQNIATIYGRTLEIDPRINAVGDFDYTEAALPAVLADIASRFALKIELQPGRISVTRR